VVTAPYLFGELFDLFNESIEDYVNFLPVDPWYRYSFPDGDAFNYAGGDALLAEIERVAPKDLDGYLKFRKYSEELFNRGYGELGDIPFSKVGVMLRQTPYIIKQQAYRSLYGMVSSFIKSEKLRQVFATPSLLVGGSPLETPAIYGLIHALEQKWGVWFAQGGTGALIKALGALLERQGVTIRLDSTVESLGFRDGKVRTIHLEDGETIEADLVVSNMDPAWVYENLMPSKHSGLWKRRLPHMRFSFGLFVLFFATKKAYTDVAHHTIILQSDYKKELKAITRTGEFTSRPNIYLHRPVATQAAIHKPGEELYYALVPVPNLKIDKQSDWSTRGPWLEEQTLATLEERGMPDLSANLNECFYTDPTDFKSRFKSLHGAGFSISPDLTQSAWLRFHNESNLVNNLYFVGAGTHPGAGMPGVLNSAKILERILPPVS
jgi:phytoene desaturase